MSMQQFVARVRQTATDAGGAYVPYSQCLEPTATLIKMLPGTAGGICQALCAKWIAEHANDRSLWSWLFTPGTTNVQQGKIANLMINFNESITTNRSSPAFNPTVTPSASQANMLWQDIVTDKYLGQYGVIRRGMAEAKLTNHTKVLRGNMGAALASRLDPSKWNGQNFYILISILGGGGHALCAFVGRDDICFFDPNFGDFYFENRGRFKIFLSKFWDKSGYGRSYTSFYLLDYGKRVR